MANTPKLTLPYMVASQAQKELTHNDALNDIDSLAQISVISASIATPPASPAEGDSYIIAASPTAEWAGHAGDIASYYSGWRFKAPFEGWLAWIQDNARFMVYSGSSWTSAKIYVVAGTVLAPALSFDSDTNTGLYAPSADTLGVAAGGTDVARFLTASGAVNYFSFTPASTGNAPALAADGADTNIALNYNAKGTGTHVFNAAASLNGTITATAFRQASAVTWCQYGNNSNPAAGVLFEGTDGGYFEMCYNGGWQGRVRALSGGVGAGVAQHSRTTRDLRGLIQCVLSPPVRLSIIFRWRVRPREIRQTLPRKAAIQMLIYVLRPKARVILSLAIVHLLRPMAVWQRR